GSGGLVAWCRRAGRSARIRSRVDRGSCGLRGHAARARDAAGDCADTRGSLAPRQPRISRKPRIAVTQAAALADSADCLHGGRGLRGLRGLTFTLLEAAADSADTRGSLAPRQPRISRTCGSVYLLRIFESTGSGVPRWALRGLLSTRRTTCGFMPKFRINATSRGDTRR